MTKSHRQGRILELIRAQNIYTQNELLEYLKTAGVEATQVTVSRDLHELRLVKTADGYREMSNGGSARALPAVIREFLLDAKPAQNLVVVKTTPGNAMSVARALDLEEWSDVVGTVAGDDTILVVAESSSKAASVAQKLLKLRA